MSSPQIAIEEYGHNINEQGILRYFSKMPDTVILDSSLRSGDLGKYTIIGIEPFFIFSSKNDNITITRANERVSSIGNPFSALRDLLLLYQYPSSDTSLPFLTGCMGYFSYELLHFIEDIPKKNNDDPDIDDIRLGFYNKVIIIDHIDNKLFIVCSDLGLDKDTTTLADNTEYMKSQLALAMKDKTTVRISACNNISSNFNRIDYIEMVNKAREYIRNGDIFQVNLSQRFKAQIDIECWEIFEALRVCSPAPFSAYLNFEDMQVISSSPERFLKVKGKYIETRPIKGTRPRGKNPQEDEILRQELLSSEKEFSELTMIVDLERNDLGKICEFGSVFVPRHFDIEQYANVFHAVSTVCGTLKGGVDIIDCLLATFPGGSITGAPKIRAMEIIEELETVKRGIYTGAIGYIGFDGSADLNIAIRTIIVKEQMAYYSVGGGIVWDSVAENEYEETLHKGTKMLEVLTGGKVNV